MKKTTAIIIIFCLWPVLNCYAEGLDTLIEVGKTQQDISKAYAQETKNFEGVKKAIENGAIKIGLSRDDIKKKFGEPVIAVREDAREKWIYKPASSSFFEGVKINLFFSANGALDEIRIDK